MSEFKGTSGKWVSNGNDVLIDDRSRQIQLEYNCGGFGIEREYNALLISKAPEMLKELNNIVDCWDKDVFQELDIDSIRNLIKQATEI